MYEMKYIFMVHSHCPMPKPIQIPIKCGQNLMEIRISLLPLSSMTILYKPFSIGLYLCFGVLQCEHTIKSIRWDEEVRKFACEDLFSMGRCHSKSKIERYKYIGIDKNYSQCLMMLFRFVLNVLSVKVVVLQPQELHTMRLGLTISLCVMNVVCSWIKETTAPSVTRLTQMTIGIVK